MLGRQSGRLKAKSCTNQLLVIEYRRAPLCEEEAEEMSENWNHILRDRNVRYVVDTQGQPIAILLTIEEYEHYLDLLDDEMDSQDDDLAARLTQAATQPTGGERQAFRDYLSQRQASGANQVHD